VPGQCDVEDDNIIEVFTGVTTEGACMGHCQVQGSCQNYTYFGDESHFM
jgi:hypothetical protein